jgi:D-glycero-D-manno-heptose 1,7-bisphosphate phosphatase
MSRNEHVYRSDKVKKNKKAIFFDRDGVLNKSKKINGKPFAPLKYKDFKLYKNLKKYIDKLKFKNYLIYVVTNQPDFHKKNKLEINKMHKKLKTSLGIDKIFCCYDKSDLSDCKKPNIELVRKVIKKQKIHLRDCFVIGDRWRDIDFAYNLKCKSIFINRKYNEKLNQKPDFICKSTIEAMKKVLSLIN